MRLVLTGVRAAPSTAHRPAVSTNCWGMIEEGKLVKRGVGGSSQLHPFSDDFSILVRLNSSPPAFTHTSVFSVDTRDERDWRWKVERGIERNSSGSYRKISNQGKACIALKHAAYLSNLIMRKRKEIYVEPKIGGICRRNMKNSATAREREFERRRRRRRRGHEN